MKKLILLLFIPIISFGQKFLPKSNGETIFHTKYTLSYNEFHEQAEWVHYYLDINELKESVERTNDFRYDKSVSTGSASLNDYKYSGYDRGHLAPAGDMKINRNTMSESFLLSNISPQNSSFNRGGWKKLESQVRVWAEKNNLYVITSGVLEDDLNKIGLNGVSVPRNFYKIIYEPINQKMIGFLMPNAKISKPLSTYVVNVDKIESITGIDFFTEIEDDFEEILESQIDMSSWDFISTFDISASNNINPFSNQCKGQAKSTGNQCRNKTKNKNGFCYAHQKQSQVYQAPPKTNYVGRCNATTKKGTRCKRNANNGSRYCWQHTTY